MFFLNQLFPQIVVCIAGFLAMQLDPTIPPLVGARITLTILAILITSNLMRTRTPVSAAVHDAMGPHDAHCPY